MMIAGAELVDFARGDTNSAVQAFTFRPVPVRPGSFVYCVRVEIEGEEPQDQAAPAPPGAPAVVDVAVEAPQEANLKCVFFGREPFHLWLRAPPTSGTVSTSATIGGPFGWSLTLWRVPLAT